MHHEGRGIGTGSITANASSPIANRCGSGPVDFWSRVIGWEPGLRNRAWFLNLAALCCASRPDYARHSIVRALEWNLRAHNSGQRTASWHGANVLSGRRRRSHRQIGQGVVEYGVILASVVVVAIAGFNILSGAEKAYFGVNGVAPSLAPTPPAFSPFVAPRSTSTAIVCSPSSVVIGGVTSCSVSVSDSAGGAGTAPRGSVSLTVSPAGSGTFSPSPACNLTPGVSPSITSSCSVTLMPNVVGTLTITGAYAPGSGDIVHTPSSGSATLTVTRRATTTTISSCSQSSIPVNGSTSCTVTVADAPANGGAASAPLGIVTWSSSGPGNFPTTCTLVAGAGSTSTCSVTYTPSGLGTGTHALTTSYAVGNGDVVHSNSGPSSPFLIAVTARSTSMSVSCAPTTVPLNSNTTCTATVTDTNGIPASSPQGTISWSSSQAVGTFNPVTCASPLTAASGPPPTSSCQTSYQATNTGSPIISATYSSSDGHANATASTSVALSFTKRSTSTTVACNPPTVGHPKDALNPSPIDTSSCTVTVVDAPANGGTPSSPQGTVAWTKSSGTLSSASCTLNGSGQCLVTFTATANGPVTITATYTPTDSIHASSPAGSATISIPAPPSAPSGMVLSKSGNNAVLTWPAVAASTSYNVYRTAADALSGTETFLAGNVAAGCRTGTCTYTDTSTQNNKKYFYFITAVDPSESPRSNEPSITI